MLPGEIIRTAITQNMLIFDIAQSYRQYQIKQDNNGGKPPAESYNIDDLQAVMDKVREKQGGASKS